MRLRTLALPLCSVRRQLRVGHRVALHVDLLNRPLHAIVYGPVVLLLIRSLVLAPCKLVLLLLRQPKLDQLVKSIDLKEKAIEEAGTRKKIADNEKQEELAKAAQEKAEKSIQELQAELADALLDRKMMEDKQKDLRAASRKIKRDLRDAEKEIEALKKEKKDIEDIFK